jgi:hypothetical protein
MKRLSISGFGLFLILSLTTGAWPYSITLEYFSDANRALGYARQTSAGGIVEDAPGLLSDSGQVNNTAAQGTAAGGATVQPAAVLGTGTTLNSSIIHASASAGPTDATHYEGYGQGFGDSMFGFMITPGAGEADKIWATIGFGVNGTAVVQNGGADNKVILSYTGLLIGAGADRTVLDADKTWNTLAATNFTDRQEITVLLEVNTFYTLYTVLEVGAQAFDTASAASNSGTFEAAVSIKNVQSALPQSRFIQVPNPGSGNNPTYPLIARATPLPGESWTDSRFGTRQTRITQTATLRQEYSRFDPFNANKGMILLVDITSGQGLVYRTTAPPYDQPANLVQTITDMEEVRWDPQDPNILWGFRNFSIVQLNVTTGQQTVVKDFAADTAILPILQIYPGIYRITCMNEGESSRDKRFWALALQHGASVDQTLDYAYLYLFTWDRQTNQVLGTYQLSQGQRAYLDWVGMSTLGNWVVIGGTSDAGFPANWGLMMASKDFSVLHRLASNTAHADVGLDTKGREVVVMQNTGTDYVDLIPLDLQARPVEVVGDYTGNLIKPLVRLYYDNASPLGFQGGVHISCNYPGYCLISTTMPPALPEQNWLDRCNILVRLDRNRVRAVYLSKIYNTTQHYWEETHGTMSNDGTRIVWADNWGNSVPEGQTAQMTVTQLDLPPNWQKQFSATLLPIFFLLLGN